MNPVEDSMRRTLPIITVLLVLTLFTAQGALAMIIIRPGDTGNLEMRLSRGVFVLNTQSLAGALSGAGFADMKSLAKADTSELSALLQNLSVQSRGKVLSLGQADSSAALQLAQMLRQKAARNRGNTAISEETVKSLLSGSK